LVFELHDTRKDRRHNADKHVQEHQLSKPSGDNEEDKEHFLVTKSVSEKFTNSKHVLVKHSIYQVITESSIKEWIFWFLRLYVFHESRPIQDVNRITEAKNAHSENHKE